jgi:hypothetical protein
MARTVMIASDLTGAPDAKPVEFAVNGKAYEIDLTDKEKADLEKALTKYIEKARTGSRRAGKAPRPQRTSVGAAPATVRKWAQSNGMDVPARGRIPESVLEQFRAANPS